MVLILHAIVNLVTFLRKKKLGKDPNKLIGVPWLEKMIKERENRLLCYSVVLIC